MILRTSLRRVIVASYVDEAGGLIHVHCLLIVGILTAEEQQRESLNFSRSRPGWALHSSKSRLFAFNPIPGFKCIVAALKSLTVAHKTRAKFLLKFVRDISTKMTLSSFLCISFPSGI